MNEPDNFAYSNMANGPDCPGKSDNTGVGSARDANPLRAVAICNLCGAPVDASVGIDERYCDECRLLDSGSVR